MNAHPNGILVVAAFWAEDGDSDELQALVDRRIKGSGSVVTFTSEQANQPALAAAAEAFASASSPQAITRSPLTDDS
jgi:hypothetical protein